MRGSGNRRGGELELGTVGKKKVEWGRGVYIRGLEEGARRDPKNHYKWAQGFFKILRAKWEKKKN